MTKPNRNKLINLGLIIVYSISVLSLTIYEVSQFVVRTFGRLPISQILYHIQSQSNVQALDRAAVILLLTRLTYAFIESALLGVLLILILYPDFRNRIYRRLIELKNWLVTHTTSTKNVTYPVLFLLVSLGTTYYSWHYVDRKFHFIDNLTAEKSTWFENHFAILDPYNVKFANNTKRNLIYISLESMEYGYRNGALYEENLTPELVALEKEGLVFRGYQRTPGSSFTMDGLSAQLLGVPVIIHGFDIHTTNNYRPLFSSVPSIFNVLKNSGYHTVNFNGISGEFTKTAEYFNEHGIQDIHFI